ncbi:efflux RND transporter periplasmic adaptor subunit [Myxococcus xanthus]|uniref:efflux RND transporter periplasmic adaptor subunit n=1 Tax=Myxococcus xanthus TaxID=34 RepID=UPI001F3F15B9|nr:efflux RND transporter periplasmic adaptor subunit [Myxococcus xanthus]
MAAPNLPLFCIGDVSSLWLVVHAFERDAVRIHRGTQARITFAAFPGQEFAQVWKGQRRDDLLLRLAARKAARAQTSVES